ncbi:phosphohistidine phosphatase SixA [Pseudomonas mangiferae]|uniref:Phosphohistidine phosphatase SixA n=1 Tax=Pseudomonas mangiferae TaxID=2593654 RepID=A0A553GXW1_9PSED|nr:phosphohistidine phosphatase SixA [Pseudomonas mangiferae]TRX74329.1 phosphohistidine phosphatase SixA [Pseudomonas mangiferae]
MRIWLLRHGEAEAQARSDPDRRLTARGRDDVQRVAERLAGRPLQAIFASPYVRAQQSAALVREALGFAGAVNTLSWVTPESSPRQALDRLADYQGGEWLLVTHNPFVGQLASLLLHGHVQEPLPMGTAYLAELEGELPLAGGMTLRALHRPE